MQKRFPPAYLFSVVALLLAPSMAYACSCVDFNESKDARYRRGLNGAAVVFSGRVTRVETRSGDHPTLVVAFMVDRVWKGAVAGQQTVYTADNSAACGYSFDAGERYIVFASGTAEALWTGLCDANTHASSESDVIRALGSGTVVGSTVADTQLVRTLAKGTVVRLRAPSIDRIPLQGRVLRISQDTILIRPRTTIGVTHVPIAAITRAEIQTGRRGLTAAVVTGAVIGGAIGAFVSSTIPKLDDCAHCTPKSAPPLTIALSTAVGAAIGGQFGFVFGPRQWRALELR